MPARRRTFRPSVKNNKDNTDDANDEDSARFNMPAERMTPGNLYPSNKKLLATQS